MQLERLPLTRCLSSSPRRFFHALCRRPNIDQQSRVNALQRHLHLSTTAFCDQRRARSNWERVYLEEGNIPSYFYQSANPLLTPNALNDLSGHIHCVFDFYEQQVSKTAVNSPITAAIESTPPKEGAMRAELLTSETGPARRLPFAIDFLINKEGVFQSFKKCVRGYDEKGNLSSEKIYDLRAGLESHTFWTYTSEGKLKEINTPNGTVKYDYDEKGNRVKETCVESGLVCYNSYDASDRLIERKEVDENREEHIWKYSYEDSSVKETLPNGRSILHVFTPGSKIEMQFRLFSSTDRPLRDIIKSIYDLHTLQHVIKVTYNAQRQVVARMFSNHTVETRQYSIRGDLKKITYPSGRVITYKTDSQGRAISKRTVIGDCVLNSIKYTYNGSLLVSETHKDGTTINYAYSKGRLEKICYERFERTYCYDSIGRKTKEIDCIEKKDPVVRCYTYDGPGSHSHASQVDHVDGITTHYDAWHKATTKKQPNTYTEGEFLETYDHRKGCEPSLAPYALS